MNSDMVKPEKFGHLHLVYHFTVPLSVCNKVLMSESQAHRFITTTSVSKNMVKQNLLANVYLMPSDTIQC